MISVDSECIAPGKKSGTSNEKRGINSGERYCFKIVKGSGVRLF